MSDSEAVSRGPVRTGESRRGLKDPRPAITNGTLTAADAEIARNRPEVACSYEQSRARVVRAVQALIQAANQGAGAARPEERSQRTVGADRPDKRTTETLESWA